jgi:hypothetical protein
MRQDPCCHYNAEGHRALVPFMERIVLQQLDGKPRNLASRPRPSSAARDQPPHRRDAFQQ